MGWRSHLEKSGATRIDLLYSSFSQIHQEHPLNRVVQTCYEGEGSLEREFPGLIDALLPEFTDKSKLEEMILISLSFSLLDIALEEALMGTQNMSENVGYLERLSSSPFHAFHELIQTSPLRLYHLGLRVREKGFQSYVSSFSTLPIHPLRDLQRGHRQHFLTSKLLRASHATLLGYLYIFGSDFPSKISKGERVESVLFMFASQVRDILHIVASPHHRDDLVPELLEKAVLAPSEPLESPSVADVLRRLDLALQSAREYRHRTITAITTLGPPPWWMRAIPTALVAVPAAYILFSGIAGHAVDIKQWARDNVILVRNFFSDWIIQPLREMFTTIRYKESKLSVIRPDELEAEIKALRGMVGGYALDSQLGAEEISDAVERSLRGDISLVLRKYQEEIRNPIKNALFGDLLRLMLIQVQSMKVDVTSAMSSLDKLLRSNELNFAFLSIVPSLLLLSFLVSRLRAFLPNRVRYNRQLVFKKINEHLRTIHIHLNKSSIDRNATFSSASSEVAERQGVLLSEVSFLHSFVAQLSGREAQMLSEDLEEIEASNLTFQQKIETIHRIYLTYPPLRS